MTYNIVNFIDSIFRFNTKTQVKSRNKKRNKKSKNENCIQIDSIEPIEPIEQIAEAVVNSQNENKK